MRQQGTVILRLWKYFFNFYGAALLFFLVVPVLVIVPLSFNAGSFLSYPLTGFSTRWYREFFNSGAWLGALGNSLMIAPLATLLATVLGVLAAIGLVRGEFRGKALVMAVLISPMIAPGVFSGALFAFATSFDEVIVTLFLASPRQRTLPLQMLAGIRENLDPTIAAAASMMVGAALVLLIVMEVLRRRSEKLKGGH